MGNIMNLLKRNALAVAAVILCILMLFIPMPALILEIMLGLETLFAIAVFIYSFTNHRRAVPALVLFFALFSFLLNIGVTRTSLNEYMGGQRVPVKDMLSSMAGGENFIQVFLISVVLLGLQMLLVSKGTRRVAEVAARFALDTMNSKMFEIDSKLNQKSIDENELKKLKRELMADVDYYSSLDGAARFLSGVAKANVCIILVNLIGGILIQMQNPDLSFIQALKNSIMNTSGNVIIFTVPLMIVSIAASLTTADNYRVGNLKEGKNSDNSEIEVEGDPEVKAALQKRQAEIIQNAECTEEGK